MQKNLDKDFAKWLDQGQSLQEISEASIKAYLEMLANLKNLSDFQNWWSQLKIRADLALH